MSGCKATCLHRAFVLEHRYEMEVWLKAKDIGGLGYAEETRGWVGVQPPPRHTDRMIHREKAPEVVTVPTEPTVFSSKNAEETLLAVALRYEEGVKYIEQLDLKEFQHPINNAVARSIVTLERSGIRADADAVEKYIKDNNLLPSDIRWDSSPTDVEINVHDGQQPPVYGLQKWEEMATVPASAPYLRDEIRAHYQAYQVDAALSWGQTAMSDFAASGITKEKTAWVVDQVGKRLEAVKPDFPGQQVSRLTVQKSQNNRPLATTARPRR
jgi:hypothetical protein